MSFSTTSGLLPDNSDVILSRMIAVSRNDAAVVNGVVSVPDDAATRQSFFRTVPGVRLRAGERQNDSRRPPGSFLTVRHNPFNCGCLRRTAFHDCEWHAGCKLL